MATFLKPVHGCSELDGEFPHRRLRGTRPRESSGRPALALPEQGLSAALEQSYGDDLRRVPDLPAGRYLQRNVAALPEP